MSGAFKIGEIVIGQNHVFDTEYNGMEGEITGGLQPLQWILTDGSKGAGVAYIVRWANGEECAADEINLRRKQPPKREIDTVVSWENCAWRPVGVPA